MSYKTIVLELLQEQYPTLHARLCQERKLPKALHQYAIALKKAHVAWMNELRRASPACDQAKIASEALELAIQHLQGDLPSESRPSVPADEGLSLDAAMNYIRRASSRA